jgi:hypothetical protein
MVVSIFSTGDEGETVSETRRTATFADMSAAMRRR